jgi:pimeloyl-ACP methyl ester carboxylesterase
MRYEIEEGLAWIATDGTRKMAQDRVYLLHGLAAHHLVMLRLASRLRRAGFDVRNWGYRSIRSPIKRHAVDLCEDLARDEADEHIGAVHVVAHSMGSIITRVALQEWSGDKLGKVVMLGPPNRGSHVARRLSPWLGRICPPLCELSDAPGSFVNCIPAPQRTIPVGIVAAAADRVIARHATELEWQTDWIVLPGQHGVLPLRNDTAQQVLHFLEHGKFQRQVDLAPMGPAAPC